MWISHFQICLQSSGITALRPLSDLILAEPTRYQFFDFRRIVGQNGLGQGIPMGFPYARMFWDELPQTDIDVLQQLAGQPIYVRAETNDGVPRKFQLFEGYAQRLVLGEPNRSATLDGHDSLRQRRSVEWEWSQLIAYTASVFSFGP